MTECNHDYRVVDTRDRGDYTYRSKKCLHCGEKICTVEITVQCPGSGKRAGDSRVKLMNLLSDEQCGTLAAFLKAWV